jgi:branched-chain amino acid transport system substrate-binding protein
MLLASAAAAALIVAGCSAGATPSTAPATPTTGPTVAPTSNATEIPPKTLVVGAALPLTGAVAPDGTSQRNGYELWKDTVNAAGGIQVGSDRYLVEMKYYDYQSDTSTAVKLVEKLITEDHAAFLFGPFGSGATEAVAAVTEKYQVPMLAPSANAPPVYSHGYKYIFGILGPPSNFADQSLGDFLLAAQPQLKTMSIIARNDLFPLATANAFKTTAEAHGLTISSFDQYQVGATDLSAPLINAKSAGADILLGTGYIQDLTLMTKQAKEQRVEPRVFIQTDGPANAAYINALGADANFMVTPAWWSAAATFTDETQVFESTSDYAQQFEAQFGEVPGYVAAAASACGVLLQKSIEKAQSIDPTEVRKALADFNESTHFGVIKFNEQGQNIGSSVLTLQVLNQELKVIGPASAKTGDMTFPFPSWSGR